MAVPCTEKEREEIKQNIQQFITLTKFYGLTTENLNLEHTIDWWATLIGYIPIEGVKDVDGSEYTKSRVITLTKYKTAAFVAAWSFTDLPPHPFNDVAGERDLPHILIGGRYHKYVSEYMLRKPVGSELRLSFLQTIIQSKALMVRPDEQFVRYAEIKTFEKLTGTKVFQQIVRGDIPEIKISLDCKQMQDSGNQCTGPSTEHLQSPDFRDKMPRLDTNSSEQYKRTYIKRALRRTVESLFPSKYTDQHRLAYTLPSASANYNFTRKEFGALGHLLPIAQRLNVRPNHSLISFAKVEKPSGLWLQQVGRDDSR